MNFWEPCWACRVIRGDASAAIVAETQDVVVAINPFPLSPGHALVLPRIHVPDVYELPESLAGPILHMASRVACAAKLAFSANGVTLRQNNGAASDQHLFHFHLHVIPRHHGDEQQFSRVPELVAASEQQEAADMLARALANGA